MTVDIIKANLNTLKRTFTTGNAKVTQVTFDLSGARHAGIPTIEIRDYERLMQALGRFRYLLSHETGSRVLYRGQRKCYVTSSGQISMPPTAYRGIAEHERAAVDDSVDDYVSKYRSEFKYDPLPEQALTTEPVLQHYGPPTRWIDIVDSVPHALFFAANTQHRGKGGKVDYRKVVSGWCYVYVFAFRGMQEKAGGYWEGDRVHLCDLRSAKPSICLRPHIQHGLLFRQINTINYIDHIQLQVAVPASAVQRWLGRAVAFHKSVLVPHPHIDPYFGKSITSRFDTKWKKVIAGNRFESKCEITKFSFHGTSPTRR